MMLLAAAQQQAQAAPKVEPAGDGVVRIAFDAPAASVELEYNASRWGMYDVVVQYQSASDTQVQLTLGELQETIPLPAAKDASAGKPAESQPRRLYLAKAGKQPLKLAAASPEARVLGLVLTPAPEGKPIEQAADGSVLLHSRDATVHGVLLRYEPNPKKNTLGFWANEKDWASWDFTLSKPGKFEVLLTQGCGKGSGGSEAVVEVAGQKLPFTVEDTGGFQNWKERSLGTVTLDQAGQATLSLRALKKLKGAVMDCQQIRLVPAK